MAAVATRNYIARLPLRRFGFDMPIRRRTTLHRDERARGALIDLLDRYTEAIVNHDPSRLPFSARAKFTENGQQLPLGEGLWATASGASQRRYVEFADPAFGQVGFFGVFEEHDSPSIVAVRMKVVNHLITELETLVIRKREFLFNPAVMRNHSAILSDTLPVGRRSRQEAIACAGRYFDGIEQDDGSIIPVDPNCIRIENGVRTVLASDRDFASSTASQGFNLFQLSVSDQIDTGFFEYIPRIRSRRFPLVDPTNGLVLALVVFDQPGVLATVNVKGHGKLDLPPLFKIPTSVMIAELFRIEDGQIRGIDAVLDFMPYGIKSGW
jgi:hypothetical protein